MSALPAAVENALTSWLGHHDRLAPGVIEGLYLVGSAALDDWRSNSDIDIVAFTADPTDADVVARLEIAHDAYSAETDRPPVDGPVLGWTDVTSPPIANQRPWTLDGEFNFDGDCFEINPVTWFTLATSGIAVRGEPASALGVHLDRADREAFCRENLRTYWRGVRDEVAAVLADDPDRTEYSTAMTEWCTLGVARLAYTIETGAVSSKYGAGQWAAGRFPAHVAVLHRALQIRDGGVDEPSSREDVAKVADWMTVLVD